MTFEKWLETLSLDTRADLDIWSAQQGWYAAMRHLEATMEEWNAEDYPLPEWAGKRSDGNYMEPGAQLATRDGRRTGNAYVDRIDNHDSLGPLAVVVTDMGNTFRMTPMELNEAFYPPAYVMRLDEARARRGVTPN